MGSSQSSTFMLPNCSQYLFPFLRHKKKNAKNIFHLVMSGFQYVFYLPELLIETGEEARLKE